MKKFVLPLLVVALLLATTSPAAADGPYRRVVIPATGLSVAIQPLEQTSEGWEEPNGVTAFFLEPWPQAIYMPWAGWASPGGGLWGLYGARVLLHKDWCAEDEPLQLKVFAVQTIKAKDEKRLVLDRVGGRVFALITYPPCGNVEQRLVVWAVADRPH